VPPHSGRPSSAQDGDGRKRDGAITGPSVPLGQSELIIGTERIVGVRHEISSDRQACLGDGRLPGSGDQPPKVARPVRSAGLSQGLLRTPRVGGTAPGPHRNPMNETAHPDTLVMRVKGTKNSRSAAPTRVSLAVRAFSQVSALGMTELLKSEVHPFRLRLDLGGPDCPLPSRPRGIPNCWCSACHSNARSAAGHHVGALPASAGNRKRSVWGVSGSWLPWSGHA
jgi:hypothetical protein